MAQQQHLYFIDWGNTVDISQVWRPALKYLQAVMTGDAEAIADALVELGSEPEAIAAARNELIKLVEQTLAETEVAPLGYDFALTLYREGQEGLVRRAELAINLATAISRQGIVIRADYMHLTRSFTAMIGSYMGIYRGLPRVALAQDILQVMLQFPAVESMRQFTGYQKKVLRQIRRDSSRRLMPARAG